MITIVANYLQVFGWSSKYRGALNKEGFQGDVRDVEESQIIYPKGSMGVLRKGLTMINPTILLWGWDEGNIKTLPWEGGLDPDRISRSTELVEF